MADKIPVKAIYTLADVTSLGEFNPGDTIPVANGGTGAVDATGARTNLGLASMAIQESNDVEITGGTIDGTVIGGTTPAAVNATALSASGNTTIGGVTAHNPAGFGRILDVYHASAAGVSFANDISTYQIGASGANFNLSKDGSNMVIFNSTGVSVSGNTTLGHATTDTVVIRGSMAVGTAAIDTARGIGINHTALVGPGQYGLVSDITGSASGTTAITGVFSRVSSLASVYTVAEVRNLYSSTVGKGAGSTITDVHGLKVEDQAVGNNNYGITSLVSAGTNKWNIYASGTAPNYFAGSVGIANNAVATYTGSAIAISRAAFGSLPAGPYVHSYTAANAYPTGSPDPGSTVWKIKGGAPDDLGAAWLTEQTLSGVKWRYAAAGIAGSTITWSNHMMLDVSGNLFVNATALGQAKNHFAYSPGNAFGDFGHENLVASGTAYTRFLYNGSAIGSITQSGTAAVAYNTTSDHRLKTNVRPANASRFNDIEFVDFEWIDGRHDCGVIAHQLQSVYPDLVVGDKDATEIRAVEISPAIPAVTEQVLVTEAVFNDDGEEIEPAVYETVEVTPAVKAVMEDQTFPVYQQVNYQGLIGRMGTRIQIQDKQLTAQAELIAKMEARLALLEARLALLEAA